MYEMTFDDCKRMVDDFLWFLFFVGLKNGKISLIEYEKGELMDRQVSKKKINRARWGDGNSRSSKCRDGSAMIHFELAATRIDKSRTDFFYP